VSNINKQYIRTNIVDILTDNACLAETLTEKIYYCESQSQLYSKYSTYRSIKYRDKAYKDLNERCTLQKQILNELISYRVLFDESDICLGRGGCKPTTFLASQKFFQIIGLPGSGKSYVANALTSRVGAYVIDSDFAKRKFPEFLSNEFASSLLHEESNKITYSKNENSVFTYCLKCGYSMVMPRIGHSLDGLTSYLMLGKNFGYKIYLIFMDISLNESLISSYKRFYSTGRYTPLSKIKYEYGTLPEMNYHLIKQNDYIAGYARIKTNLYRTYNVLENYGLDKYFNTFIT
jgi:hypothetical protein